MRKLIHALVLMPALTLPACGGGGGDDPSSAMVAAAGLREEFLLGGGERLNLGALKLEFTAVKEERCGVGATVYCVWQGNAQVFITATKGQSTELLTPNTFPDYPTSAVFAGYVIELRQLDPQPDFQDTGRPSLGEYQATLFVDGVP